MANAIERKFISGCKYLINYSNLPQNISVQVNKFTFEIFESSPTCIIFKLYFNSYL